MKLSKVIIRNFKQFDEIVFDIPDGGVVVAGPNNCGKTTLLQAIATWGVAFECWRNLNDMNPRNAYTKAPMSRQSLHSVPLLKLSALWRNAKPQKRKPIEITLGINDDELPMEIIYDTTEQLYVRPKAANAWTNKTYRWNSRRIYSDKEIYNFFDHVVFVPSMTGISLEEPLYQRAKIQQLVGQSKPGEALRNLLVEAHNDEFSWKYICDTIKDIFDYELLSPNSQGANIVAEYRHKGVTLDIASAGAGFLQILLLLAFFAGKKDCILLLDEPDAHLHILLQDRIYAKLKDFAHKSNSTLILATHSERIVNAVPAKQVCSLFAKPKSLARDYEQQRLISGLSFIDNTDILLAENKPGVLYVEGPSDIGILREWARVLGHPLLSFLVEGFWKPSRYFDDEEDIFAKKHFDALQQINSRIIGVELYDSDGKRGMPTRPSFKGRFKRFFWRRYEIENYLMHPESVADFIAQMAGQPEAKEKAMQYMKDTWTPAFCENPWGENHLVNNNKGKDLLFRVFQKAGIDDFSNYSELAAATQKENIHLEVVEKLDAIAKAFGIM